MRVLTAVSLWLVIAVAIVIMFNPGLWSAGIPWIAVFALAALLLVAFALGWQRPELSPVMAPLAALTLWGLLQLGLGKSVYAWNTKLEVLYWSANLAVFFAALQAFADSRVRSGFLNALLMFGFVLAIIAPVQSLDPANRIFWVFAPDPHSPPPFGPFPYKNQYAAFVELLLPYALYRAVTEESRTLLHGLVVAVLYTSVIAATSRMGFFLVTAEMVVVPAVVMWQRRIPFRRIRTTAVWLLVILGMLAAAAGPNVLIEKFETPDPYAGRREFTEASLVMIRDRPWLGFGLGTWSTVYPGYAKSDIGLVVNEAHDDWAQWAAEGGLPFFAIMLSIALWTTRRALRTGWGLGVVAVFIHCLVDYPIQRAGVALVMFTMLAAVASTDRKTNRKTSRRLSDDRRRINAPL